MRGPTLEDTEGYRLFRADFDDCNIPVEILWAAFVAFTEYANVIKRLRGYRVRAADMLSKWSPYDEYEEIPDSILAYSHREYVKGHAQRVVVTVKDLVVAIAETTVSTRPSDRVRLLRPVEAGCAESDGNFLRTPDEGANL
jgi:hypothetical protein